MGEAAFPSSVVAERQHVWSAGKERALDQLVSPVRVEPRRPAERQPRREADDTSWANRIIGQRVAGALGLSPAASETRDARQQ